MLRVFCCVDLKLRIVTIVERPFIIRNEVQNGATEDPNGSGFARGGGGEKSVYYTGCCVDILNAIQKELRNSTNGLSFQYEMYEVADNKYGIVDPHTNKWNGLIGTLLRVSYTPSSDGFFRGEISPRPLSLSLPKSHHLLVPFFDIYLWLTDSKVFSFLYTNFQDEWADNIQDDIKNYSNSTSIYVQLLYIHLKRLKRIKASI